MRLFFVLFALLLLNACTEETEAHDRYLPEANGQHGEILLLLDDQLWENEVGKGVIENLTRRAEGPYLRPEPMFGYFRKRPADLNHLNQLNRNILKFMVANDSVYQETAVIQENNYYAKNQLFVIVKDSDPNRLANFAKNGMDPIIDLFNKFELKQLTRTYLSDPNYSLKEIAENKYGISVSFPNKTELKLDKKNFTFMKRDRSKNLLPNDASNARGGTFWVQQGFMIWSEPLVDANKQMDIQHILSLRDSVLKKNVAGRVKGTYMTTEYDPYYQPEAKELTVNGNKVIEIRGLWKNDGIVFTGGGGPFVQHTVISEAQQKVVTVCGYVYAPKFDKREYIRELDAVLNTIELLP